MKPVAGGAEGLGGPGLDAMLESRKGARPNDEAKRAANMLESLFVRQLFSAMRKTVPEGGLTGESMDKSIYTEMLDGELADEIGRGGGLGIGKALALQLGDVPDKGRVAKASDGPGPLPLGALPPRVALPRQHELARATEALRKVAGGASSLAGLGFDDPSRPNSVRLSDAAPGLGRPVVGAATVDERGTVRARAKESVLALRSGTVVEAGGGRLVVDHGGGLKSVYADLGQVLAQRGDLVLRGQMVGEVGSSGAFRLGVQRGATSLQPAEINGLIGTQKDAQGR
ncbi:MAG: peptidoglycan DD-metalloendopeptidase family protein [Deltaproteobacteria bacterium]|nr:peptidoglycan DD-metalloendopeptidase family protein [Deltaproteobacteria bacterium]